MIAPRHLTALETDITRAMRALHATGRALPDDWLPAAEDLDRASAAAVWGTAPYTDLSDAYRRARDLWRSTTGHPPPDTGRN
jgi:hypothetical protein